MTEHETQVMILQMATDRVVSWLDGFEPRMGIVLGSGLAALADRLVNHRGLPYSEAPGFHAASVAGHLGELVAGELSGVPVLVQNGRFHMYEGHDAACVALPVRVMANLGIRQLIVTNAAGGIRQDLQTGSVMLIADHLNLTGRNPCVGAVLPGEQRFFDMRDAYDPELRVEAAGLADELGIPVSEGVYAGLLGPSFETPAEISMLRSLGADAVGMSTVMEVIAARAREMRCLGVSLIGNSAAAISGPKLEHADVLRTAIEEGGGERLASLIEALVSRATPDG